MNTLRTPNNIEVLLHYYSSPAPHPRSDAPAVREATLMLLESGALESLGERLGNALDERQIYLVTPLGAAWVTELTRVPKPRVAFVDENGEIIE